MKRSEINAVIKKFEALLEKYSFALPPRPKSGKPRVTNMMKSVTICWAGM